MEDSDQQCEYHLEGICRAPDLDVTGQHHGLEGIRNPGYLSQTDSECGSEEESHDRGRDSQYGNELSESVEHADVHDLPVLKNAVDNENDTVAGIAHAHCEEQEEENRQYRGRVPFSVNRHSVHSGDALEQLAETVVLQFDRRIVLLHGLFLDIVDIHLVEFGAEPFLIIHRGESRECDDAVLRSLLAGRAGKISVQFRAGLFQFSGKFARLRSESCKSCLAADQLCVQALKLCLALFPGACRCRTFLGREVIFPVSGSHDYEMDVLAVIVDNLEGVFGLVQSLE